MSQIREEPDRVGEEVKFIPVVIEDMAVAANAAGVPAVGHAAPW